MWRTTFTCGDIFPDASDRDGCTLYPISVSIFNYSLYPSMDLYRQNRSHIISSSAKYYYCR